MSLDGIVVRAIAHELNHSLKGGRIDKVHQPESDELLIQIRNEGASYKLLLSASSSNPRIHFTETAKKNPQSPPTFCMLLRKHIQGGKIIEVVQPSLERVVKIKIDSTDELGDLTTKELIIELMGKHSNIILTKADSGKILDSIKRIPVSVSTVRQLLPGLDYVNPPQQQKQNPLELDFESSLKTISQIDGNIPTSKALLSNFLGLSPLIAREICFRSGLDSERLLILLDSKEKEQLAQGITEFYSEIRDNRFYPNIVKDRDNLEVRAFSAVKLLQYGDYPVEEYSSMSKVLEYFYLNRDNTARIKQKSSELRKTVSLKLERIINKVEKQKLELKDSEKRETYKIKGDLITANMHIAKKGDSSLTVQNYYSEDLEQIEIKLDPRLTPSENAQKYYKKYNKLKSASILLIEQISKAEEEIDYLQNIIYSIDNCTEAQEIDEIKEELVKEGYLKKSSIKSKKVQAASSKPHEFISQDGYTIYVGKNNKQNDLLTMKTAAKEDVWLHTKDIPGSHVIVKANGESVPESTLLEASLLAAHYSKASDSSNVPVDYALRKNVRKPNGAKPGMVIYENNSTLYVTPDKREIAKIKKVESN